MQDPSLQRAIQQARGWPRISLSMPAMIRKANTSQRDKVTLIDLSPIGCQFDGGYAFRRNDMCWLTIGQFAPIESKIVWKKSFIYGCQFLQVLHSGVFNDIARSVGYSDMDIEALRIMSINAAAAEQE